MTIEERGEKFKAELKELSDKYGVDIQPVIQWEGLPPNLQATGATIRLIVLEGWQPPPVATESEDDG